MLSACVSTGKGSGSSSSVGHMRLAQATPAPEEGARRGPCPGFSSGIAELEYVMAEHNKNL